MDLALVLLLGLVVGVVLGLALGVLVGKRRASAPGSAEDVALVEARHQAELVQVRADEAAARAALEREQIALRGQLQAEHAATCAQLQSQLAGVSATVRALQGEVAGHERRYGELIQRHQAELEAQKRRDGAESRILQELAPVKETLRTMQGKVTDLESQRSQQYGAIAEQLSQARAANEQIRATAESLASALRNNSTRGVWGETQLRNVVEAAGLTNRVDFSLQTTVAGEHGAGRPDMVVRLPGGKSIAVDAKVPYSRYLDASAIPATATGDDEARRRSLLADHARQVKAHIDALAGKAYWTGLDASPEFTIAFIPSEALLAAALEQDPGLLEYAFNKRVPLASPVSLWAVLKTVAFTWQQDVLTEDAKRLFDLGKTLYQRLATLAEHSDGLRKSIERTVDSYNRFASSLEGRVLVTARQLDKLDPAKVIPQPQHIESAPKKLTAMELTSGPVDHDAMDGPAAVAELEDSEPVPPTEDVVAVIERELDAVADHQPELIDLGALRSSDGSTRTA